MQGLFECTYVRVRGWGINDKPVHFEGVNRTNVDKPEIGPKGNSFSSITCVKANAITFWVALCTYVKAGGFAEFLAQFERVSHFFLLGTEV